VFAAPTTTSNSCPELRATNVHVVHVVSLLVYGDSRYVQKDVQGCLGWDHKREKRQGTYPATLTSDKWFVLASRTQHVLHMLRQCEDLSEAEALTDFDGAPKQQQGRVKLVQKLMDATHTLQGSFAST
jgi:hypothetical protein